MRDERGIIINPRKIKYNRTEQLKVAHKNIQDIYDRHKDKRKVLSKEELNSLELYLKTSKNTSNPLGRMLRLPGD
tara:strand:- start:3027 stop:3251 length:225 start_codon:yes stop_codon:yes gene_type:complete